MQYEENRWLQRFQNYQRALYHLDAAVERGVEHLEHLEIQGLIKGFEMTFDLAWKTLKDYMEEQGTEVLSSPKPVLQTAFKLGLIAEGNTWIEMVDSRNAAAHSYDEAMALRVANDIADKFYRLFDTLDKTFMSIKNAQ